MAQDESKEKNYLNQEIIVEMLDLRWFYAMRKNFVAFSTVLASMPVNFYSSKFTILMLDYFWDETQRMILKK